MRLFGRDEMSLGRVHGSLVIKEGFDKLTLYVDADAMRLVVSETWGGEKAHVFALDAL